MRRARGSRLLFITFLVGVLYITGTAVFGERGLIAVFGMQRDAKALESKVSGLESDLRDRHHEVEALRENDEAVERIAREQNGYVRSDEVIYRFEKDEGSK